MTSLYLDVHVPAAIAAELRRRGVDVLTAQEDGATELEDDGLLIRAGSLGRLLFTQDIRFKALAEDWQRASIRQPHLRSPTSRLHRPIHPRPRTHRQSHQLGGLGGTGRAIADEIDCNSTKLFQQALPNATHAYY